ncbi:MAG: bifunctional 2-polyprenyl-6-hydroxyphenol methylase/3-demethylubiquinol 3-O-methyltransferase UbiG, partial [Gammaproteobacteria bacterium]
QLQQAGDKRFDVITCMELLEHVPDPRALIHTMAQLLNNNGHIILSTINRSLAAYLGAIVAAEYVLRLLPRGTHDYARFIRPSELSAWLRDAGFSVQDIVGLRYLPGVDHCSISRSPGVNYMLHARLGR